MSSISRPMHGALDYVFGILLSASPWIFRFSENDVARGFALTFGGGTLLYSLLTNYEAGVVRLIPFPGHLLFDGLTGLLLLSNWLHFGFTGRPAVVFTAFGAMEAIVLVMTLRGRPASTTAMT